VLTRRAIWDDGSRQADSVASLSKAEPLGEVGHSMTDESAECFPPGSAAWRIRFHWYCLSALGLGVGVGAFLGVPIVVAVVFAMVGVGAAALGTWSAKRVELCVMSDRLRYCNGIVVMEFQVPEISGVKLARENVPASSARGIQLLTRGPDGNAPREYRLGTVPFVSVGLPVAERQRLVRALARLLGDDAVSSLRPWSSGPENEL
jgi:hypothetical protein